MRILFLIAALAALSACATLSEEECRAGNWTDIGLRDGADGREPDHLSRHAKACADYGIAPDAALWEEGRQAGIPLYCRPERAWREGADGRRLTSVCIGPDLPGLQRANQRGLTYHRIGQDIDEAERQISRINSAFGHPALPPEDRNALLAERASLRLEIAGLRAERLLYRY